MLGLILMGCSLPLIVAGLFQVVSTLWMGRPVGPLLRQEWMRMISGGVAMVLWGLFGMILACLLPVLLGILPCSRWLMTPAWCVIAGRICCFVLEDPRVLIHGRHVPDAGGAAYRITEIPTYRNINGESCGREGAK